MILRKQTGLTLPESEPILRGFNFFRDPNIKPSLYASHSTTVHNESLDIIEVYLFVRSSVCALYGSIHMSANGSVS